jgi:hypothetical protein
VWYRFGSGFPDDGFVDVVVGAHLAVTNADGLLPRDIPGLCQTLRRCLAGGLADALQSVDHGEQKHLI